MRGYHMRFTRDTRRRAQVPIFVRAGGKTILDVVAPASPHVSAPTYGMTLKWRVKSAVTFLPALVFSLVRRLGLKTRTHEKEPPISLKAYLFLAPSTWTLASSFLLTMRSQTTTRLFGCEAVE